VFEVLTGERPGPGNGLAGATPAYLIEPAADPAALAAYRELRTRVFVAEQNLFEASDTDDRDDDPRTVVLVARAPDGAVIGGVRLGPAGPGPDIGWWYGGRLVVDPAARRGRAGADLVRAACAHAEQAGALRFDATVQPAQERFFRQLGWQPVRPTSVAGRPHVLMRWPIGRLAGLAATTKSPLGGLLAGLGGSGPDGSGQAPGGAGFRGDSGRAGARCWSTSTTWPRWAPSRPGCWTRSGPGTPRSRLGSWPACVKPPPLTTCRCWAATPSSGCPPR
jgi:putative N-acetyltransferase (TIGR04045 family)